MSILVDENTNLLVQGITGHIGKIQTKYMLDAGTNVTAGVAPGRGGKIIHGVPVYDTVQEASNQHHLDATVLFVPPHVAKESVIEAVKAGIKLIFLITEHTPVHDVMEMKTYVEENNALLIGPTTPGIITPGECKIGILPQNLFTPGPVGIVSRSGTLSYEVAANLSGENIGQSTVVGMGADLVAGTSLTKILKLFNEDPDTEVAVIIGEVGGSQEEEAAEYIKREMEIPVIAYIAGLSAPEGKRMGHAGAIAEKGGGAQSKIEKLNESGVEIVSFLHQIPKKAGSFLN